MIRFYLEVFDGMHRLSKKYMTHLREVPDDQVALPNQNIRITDTSVLQTNARRWNVNNRKRLMERTEGEVTGTYLCGINLTANTNQ